MPVVRLLVLAVTLSLGEGTSVRYSQEAEAEYLEHRSMVLKQHRM